MLLSLGTALHVPVPGLPPVRIGSGTDSPPAAAQAPTSPAPSPEEKPIRDLVAAFAKAYSTPDLKALEAFFTDDANVIDSAGETTRGKAAIIEMYASSFEENPRLILEPKVRGNSIPHARRGPRRRADSAQH